VADGENRIGGRYRLVRQLATGGMGTVWEGWDERLHRTVAIKQLSLPPALSGPDADVAVQRVMREARLTARLHHPNAVQVFDVVDDHNRPCLVMQYVPSRSLQEIVRAEGPLEPVAAARIGTQIAAALAAAHRAGIVHRDVKPGNVLIADDGTAKITDFGISHAVDDVTLTSTGLVTGTPAYLAPEVARGVRSDFASDVYSLGATLYMAVEGEPPTGNDSNPMAVLHRVASGDTNPPMRSGPLTGMLMAMMARDPADRPTMVEVATGLTDVRADGRPDRGAPEATRAIPRPDQRPARAAMPAELAPLPAELSPRPAGSSPRTAALEPPPIFQPPIEPLEPSEPPRRRRALLPALVAAALVVVVGIVLGIVLLSRNGDHTGGTAAGGTSNPPATRSSAPSRPAQSSHGQTSPPPSTPPAAHGKPTATDLANAVTDYYDVVPGNLSAGWDRLTPHFQHTKAHNRQTYDSYWNTISRVDVLNASGQPPYRAVATLVYHLKNGHTSTERTLFVFKRSDGILKIDATQVIG
jgi:eukaryotic-like serine/threonine-protein kinase